MKEGRGISLPFFQFQLSIYYQEKKKGYKKVKQFKKIFKDIDMTICCVLLVALTIVAFLQVLFRYVFNTSLSWSEELVRDFVITLIYLSAVYSIRTRSAIRVEIIDFAIKGKLKAALDMLLDLASSGVMFYVSYLATFLVRNALKVDQRSAALGIPMAVMYGVESFCFFLMGIAFIILVVQDVKKLKGDGK